MRLLIVVVIVMFFPCYVMATEYLEEVESGVYETTGSKQDIAKKGKLCIAKLVSNDEVKIADASDSSDVAGVDLFVDVDLENGTVMANNRVDYRRMLLTYNVKSLLIFMAKDGRFKIKHTNIKNVQKDTGSWKNSGYTRVAKVAGTGWKSAKKLLIRFQNKLQTA